MTALNLKAVFLKVSRENTLFGCKVLEIEGAYPINYFPGFLVKNIKNCTPSKSFLFTSLPYVPKLWKPIANFIVRRPYILYVLDHGVLNFAYVLVYFDSPFLKSVWF